MYWSRVLLEIHSVVGVGIKGSSIVDGRTKTLFLGLLRVLDVGQLVLRSKIIGVE